ncbi:MULTISPECIES: hypothetical protein [unclassified Dietzia]|uniref:hypothetical protein n=1 Tax=unclassified Dietzia TaxID=2617939 RepID=UPI000D21BAFC|nr:MULTISPECIES: hypothetical protein [unclassified Dietzia]AVZ39738.1 hypothetical protein CT688_09930 [Dietzia sp. JS16-p6b]QGW25078.1 hypothetical protein GJR88_03165 [Dietzia sp. DQ12-45-1b]
MTGRAALVRSTRVIELGVALVMLAVGAATSCVLAVAWLATYVGPVPFPFTILVAGVWSLFLVRVASAWSDRAIVAVFPALIWILTLVTLNLGPGGNMPVPIGLRGLALLVVGGLIPLWVATLGRSPRAETHRR